MYPVPRPPPAASYGSILSLCLWMAQLIPGTETGRITFLSGPAAHRSSDNRVVASLPEEQSTTMEPRNGRLKPSLGPQPGLRAGKWDRARTVSMGDRWPVCLIWMWKVPSGPSSAVTIGTLQIPGPASLGNTLCKTQTMSCQDRQALPMVLLIFIRKILIQKSLHAILFPNSKLRCVNI